MLRIKPFIILNKPIRIEFESNVWRFGYLQTSNLTGTFKISRNHPPRILLSYSMLYFLLLVNLPFSSQMHQVPVFSPFE
jgi:hypothetical protein